MKFLFEHQKFDRHPILFIFISNILEINNFSNYGFIYVHLFILSMEKVSNTFVFADHLEQFVHTKTILKDSIRIPYKGQKYGYVTFAMVGALIII